MVYSCGGEEMGIASLDGLGSLGYDFLITRVEKALREGSPLFLNHFHFLFLRAMGGSEKKKKKSKKKKKK
jgi:hypothetical protein